MNDVRWEDPPLTNRRRGGGWGGAAVNVLKERPGEWAILWEEKAEGAAPRRAQNKAMNLKTSGGRVGLRIQAVSRVVDDVVRVYGRIVP